MPSFELDLEASVPNEGFFRVLVDEAEMELAKDGESWNIVLQLSVVDAKDEDEDMFQFRMWLSTKKGALWQLRNVYRAMLKQATGTVTVSEETVEALKGKMAIILAKHGEYQGNPTFIANTWLPDTPDIWESIDAEDRRFS